MMVFLFFFLSSNIMLSVLLTLKPVFYNAVGHRLRLVG